MRSAVLLKQPKVEFLLLGVLALSSCLLQIIFSPNGISGPDIHPYVQIAQAMSDQPDFWSRPDAFEGNFWAMAYPTFLHLIFILTNNSLAAVQFIQIALAASLVFGAWALVRHLGLAVRLITAVLVALSPAVWSIASNIGYEIILAWLLMLALVTAWGWGGKGFGPGAKLAAFTAFISGLAIGLALLTQTKTLAVIPVLAYLLIKQSRLRVWFGAFGLFVAVAPWMIRNAIVLGTLNPLTNNGPYNLWVGNNPETTLGGSMLTAPALPVGESYTSAALDFITTQPQLAMSLLFRKAERLLEPTYIFPNILGPGLPQTLLHIVSAGLAVAMILGVCIYLGARVFTSPPVLPSITPIVVFVVFFYLIHIPFIAEPRFIAPLAPITLAITSAVSVFAARRFTAQRTIRQAAKKSS
jgi:hypothetical protein